MRFGLILILCSAAAAALHPITRFPIQPPALSITQPCQWLVLVLLLVALQVPLLLQQLLQVQELLPLPFQVPFEFQEPEPLLQLLLPQLEPP